MVSVDFCGCDPGWSHKSVYAVIGARYSDKWVFVRSRKRGSLEMPAGHVGDSEDAFMAAGRELSEETGATRFIIECVDNYTVSDNDSVLRGSLYLAEILELGDIVDAAEIESVELLEELPQNLSFPGVQAQLFERVSNYFNGV